MCISLPSSCDGVDVIAAVVVVVVVVVVGSDREGIRWKKELPSSALLVPLWPHIPLAKSRMGHRCGNKRSLAPGIEITCSSPVNPVRSLTSVLYRLLFLCSTGSTLL